MAGHSSRVMTNQSTPRMTKSMISAGGTLTSTTPNNEESLQSVHSGFFPFKLTATLSALKIVGGCVLVGLGAAAIIQKAGYAWKGAGIAGGVVVIISGVLGAYSVRTGASRPYVISFLLSCLCSLIASIVVIIYSATGLAADANMPYGVRLDEDGNYVTDLAPVSREAAMLINTVLIIVSFLDIIFSLPSVIITLRELCNCYDPSLLTHRHGQHRSVMSWLGHQPPVFYSHASGVPYNKMGSPYRHMMTRATPPFIQIPSEASHSGPNSRHSPRDASQSRQRTRSKSPNPRQVHSVNHHPHHQRSHHSPQRSHHSPHHQYHHHHMYPPMHHTAYSAYAPMEYYAPTAALYPAHQLIPVHPGMMAGQWTLPVYGDWTQHEAGHHPGQQRHSRDREHRHKRSRSKSQPREQASNKRKKSDRRQGKGPTDSDIEKTYTGMDRELAEEFIEQTMDAGGGGSRDGLDRDHTVSGTESEAW